MKLLEVTVTFFLLTSNLYLVISQSNGHYVDIVFLVDGSQNLARQGFQQIRSLLIKMVNRLDIGIDRYRIGLAQYNGQVHTEFLLNRFQRKDALLSHLKKKYQYKGGSPLKTGRALDYIHKTFFTASAGSRKHEGIPQIAIVITSMRSKDDVTKGANALKNDRIKILSIGVKNSDLQELQTMAFLPNYVFQTKSVNNLPLLARNITAMVHTVSQPNIILDEPRDFADKKDKERPAVCQSASVADIVFVVDESSSIGEINFQLIRDFLRNLISVLDVGPEKVQIGLLQYSSITRPEFYLNTFQNKPDILRSVQNMLYRGGATYTGEALKHLKQHYFSPSSGSRLNQGVPQIAVVVTDGKSQDDVSEAASALRHAGVSVFAFGIKDAVESELRKIASYPAESHVELLQDFDLLKKIENRIEKKICTEVLQQVSMVPKQTEQLHQGCVETEEANIFFLVDGSSSIRPESFQDLKRFLVNIVNIFSIGADQVRVAVVQYADNARMEFESTQYTHKTEVERAIKQIVQIKGGTNTGRALTYMKSFVIDAERSRKTRGRSFLITVTDGKSQDDVINPAVELRQQGVTVYAVGVGDASENELQLIAGADERVFYTDNFDALAHIENSIVRDICSKEACSKLDLADIIFLIDGSGSINAKDFLKMKQLIGVLVNKTNLGVDKVQIGLVQFSSKPMAEFQLNGHSAKADLHRAINGVQQMGGHTYTGQALTFTADYFDKARGGRPGIPQYLIVITDGEAQDEVLQPARTIRDKGVTVFAMGVFNANSTQLLEIGGAWDKVHYVENFELLEEIEQQVTWEICTHKDWCGAQAADIVFVIDGSESLSAVQFNHMKDFMVGLVNGSDVAADKVQFGAVLYGDNPQTVFQLDQFTNKNGIQNAINGMNPVGGSTHTAKALSYAKGLLDPVEGGRKQFGVPQFLLLFTGGKMEDKQQLKSAAEVIRNSDINIYAIGVENKNKNQLLQIAGFQDNPFYALEFETLGPLMKAMFQKFCDDSKPDCEVHEADVVFLIDGSGSTSASDFKRKKDILKSVVKMFNTGPTKFQFAVVEYSTTPVTIFQLNGTSGQHDLLDRIEKIQQLSQGTMTGKALQFVMDLFQPTTGSRKLQGVPQHLLVITDGKSQDSVVVPANSLRKENINVFAIGVGKANENELLQISGAPERKIYVEKFAELDQIKSRIVHNLCVPPAEDAADVVFLVEGTQDIQEFKQIQNFMMGITAELNIGLHKNRIGFAQFGRDIKTEFLLKQNANKKDVWNYIKSSSFQGGASLDIRRAIDYLKTTQFIPSAGSRKNEDIPQIAVVITKASSQADVKSHSQVLIKDGVIVVSITISDIVQQQIGLNSSSYPFIFQSLYLDDPHQHSGDVAHMIRNIIKKENQRRQPSVCQSATVADIVYLVDESSSIGETNFELIRNFLVNVINAMDIGPDKVQIGLIQYSTITTPEFYLNTFQQKREVLDHIRSVPYRKGGTHTGEAINYMVQTYFTESRGSRINQGIPQVAVIITDGKSADDVKVPASALRALGVKVFAFGIKEAVESELQSIASYPASNYVSHIEDFDLLRNVEDQMRKKICNDIVNTLLIESHQDHIIEQGCVTEEADLFFLIDGSGSLSAGHFMELKKFVTGVVSCFSIGPDQVRVGLVQYSKFPQTEFEVTQHASKTSLEGAIKQIRHAGGSTNTGAALTYMKKFISDAKASRKSSVPSFLIIVTDGDSDDNVTNPALQLRQLGVTVYAVGVGKINESGLPIIAGAKERVFYTTNFDALQQIKNNIVQDVCSKEDCGPKSDIIFLIDGSTSIKPDDFQKMKTFMTTFLNKSDVGPNKVQIGVIQFSTDPKLMFQLNKYTSKTDLHSVIDKMPQQFGNTYTGEALTFTADYFDEAKGGRTGIPQYLIVITDGEAHDEVFQPAKAIRDKGVTVFALGVFTAKYSQLLKIGGSHDRAHYVESFDGLAKMEHKISWDMCHSPSDCKWTEKADILFVIDGSGSITSHQFESMRTFMLSLVNRTNVAKNKVRIGALIFGDKPETKFELDVLQTRDDVRKQIMNWTSVGGSTYTVEALQLAKTLLGKTHGGRKEAGVPQFLILITDGQATEKKGLNSTAAAIRDSNVQILAVGVQNAVEEELRMIAGSDDKWFYVHNFTHLEYLSKNISNLICSNTEPDCEVHEADIVFLIDGSGSIAPNDFESIKKFLEYIIKTLRIGPTKFQFALAQYSSTQATEFYLNYTSAQTALFEKIKNIAQLKAGTNTGLALKFVSGFFEQSAGSRKLKGVPQFLLVITDGQSQDSVVVPASNLRKENINVIAIGVGEANADELLQISGAPDRKFHLSGYKELDKIKRRITRELCTKSAQACTIDVAVGFDSSNQTQFENMLAGQYELQIKLVGILKQITSLPMVSCDSDSNTEVRVGFYIQNNNGHMVYETRFDKNISTLAVDLQGIKMDSRVNLNTNHLKSFLKKFDESTSRFKVILLFTDGLDDPLDQLKETSRMLRKKGVHALITVALEGAYKVNQIPQIEFGTGFSYKEQLSIGMEAIGDALLKKIKSVAEKQCCNVNCVCTAEPGRHGYPGNYGMEGSRGLPGLSGHPGIDGEEGGRGSPGVTGPRGFTGCQGNRGHKGGSGYRGTKGSDGSHAIDGINGEQGEHGEFGLTGEKGKPGYLGKKGLKGDSGDRGLLGIPGDPGTPGISTNRAGETGHKGTPGLQGEMGIPGDGGIAGVPGDLGSEGSRGMLGTKGQSGRAGKQGRKGDPGIRGPQGEAGKSGPKGQKSGSGSRGQQGTNGVLGEDGIHGDPGTKGHPGHAGEPGNKGIRGQIGVRGSLGMDGTSIFGSPGVKGRKGGQGVIGNPGLQGEPGKPGQHGKEGSKGARGQRGDAGLSGEPGFRGDFGHPGSSGPKGPRGITSMTNCEFVSYIRKNCPCCSKRRGVCPAYPTELVFALDRSSDVTPVLFERMKGIVINLLQDMNIAESNCPSGARVAILTYDNEVRSFIRFSDFKRKTLLMKEIEGLRHERSTSKRNIGIGMQFVARNTFKRARNGILVRKIAVFITNGGSQDTKAVSDAVSHFGALAITPVIISFKDIPDIERVFKTVVVLPRQQRTSQELLRRVQLCTLCFDLCEPHDECSRFTTPPPLPANLDIAFVVDDLQRMETAQSETVQHFLYSMVNEFVNSPEPKASDLHPRVALVQYRPDSTPRYGKDPFNLEFGVLDYTAKTLKKRHIQDSFSQLEGSSGIGNTIEWSLKNFFSNLTNQQTYKVIFTIFSGETSINESKLLEISQEAKCKGFTMLALALGEVTNVTVLEEFVSFPFDQHLLHLDRALESEMEYAQRFAVAFLKNLAIGINNYPPAALQRECEGLKSQGTVKTRTSADSDRANIMQNMEESKDSIHDVCALNVEEGNCNNYRLKWFFSATKQICKRFWYGGCGGNKNRFDTREECEALCLKSTF